MPYAECHYAKCLMLSVTIKRTMFNVVMLNVVAQAPHPTGKF